ncbi:MAG: GtrA family protein [Hyphomonadaceae bacterium]|nr:GtrA family protein [Hyphomonadaceae bacterium]
MEKLKATATLLNPLRDGVGARYVMVILAGFVIDISIGWSLHEFARINLVASAACGFLVAMALSYFAHEYWTFARAESAYSGARLAKFAVASGATLAVRLLVVWLSAPLERVEAGSLFRLLLAFGASLMVGFVVNRLIVFSPGEAKGDNT